VSNILYFVSVIADPVSANFYFKLTIIHYFLGFIDINYLVNKA